MNADDIDHAIEEALEKLSVNLSDIGSDSDTDNEDDFTASVEKQKNDLPDSVLAYFKASSNRVNTVEQLILEDLDDLEIMCDEMFSLSQHADLLNEQGSNSDEDPLKLKERIMSEIEDQLGTPCESHDSNGDYDTEYDIHKGCERQLMFEWRSLEEQHRKQEEQRLTELECESEQCLNSTREEGEKRRCISEQFKSELRRTSATNQFEFLKPVEEDGEMNQNLQLEIVKQEELIKRLEEQIAEERRVFEEVQQEQVRRTETQRTVAATTLQAAVRGTLVRRWSKKELAKRREEERRRYEERKEKEKGREMEERMKMEWEKERRRVEEEEQHHREEAERRRAACERDKEQEHHRLERERKLGVQQRKEKKVAKMIEDERKRKEEKLKRIDERRVELEMKKVKEEEEKIRKEEKAKRIKDEIKRKEVRSPEKKEEMRVEKERRQVQDDEQKKGKEKEKTKTNKDEIKRKEGVKFPEGTEERKVEEARRNVQDEEEKKHKQKENTKRIVDDVKRKEEVELPEEMDERRAEEERRKVQEDEEKKRKEEQKIKRTENEGKRKDEKKQKGMVERRVEEERKGKEVAVKRIDDEKKKKEMQKSGGIRVMEEKNVQEGKERKKVEEAKRTEDERKRKEEERQKQIEERRTVDEEKKKKEEGEEKRAEFEIKRKEEKQERMDRERVVKERLKQKEEFEEDKTKQMPKKQPKKCRENERQGEKIIMKRNKDGENTEERNGNINKGSVIGSVDQKENPDTDPESQHTTQREKDHKFGHNVSQLCLSQDEQLSLLLTPSTDSRSVTASPSEVKNATDCQGLQNSLDYSSFACLPNSTEQKRLAWMLNCTPWSELFMQYKRKRLGAPPRRRAQKRASEHLLPLPVDAILRSGAWSSLIQVTSVTLEDLSGCSLSTLSECTRLQSLSLRRCKLQALNGLNQCTELQYIDLQENNITYIDCGGLTKLEVLLLGRNQLTSIHGLNDAVNLSVLQLSHNIISRISRLGSLKKLHRLIVDHNQLISTRGLSESLMLLHLDCSYNHLSHVEGLENCALLNTLDLRGNNLTELPVLKNHVLLRELYLDDNSICSLNGLDSCWLPLLRCLSVTQNSITQLPLLVDLISLKTLDVSYNCLSELRNICMSLEGCTHLQELSITDNPVQQENNWRSSVLAVNSSLIKLNGEQTGASGTLSADSTQLWSFQALCQAHQDQIDSVLQRHSMEIRSAPSALHAQLLVGNHTAELFHLAEQQRYDHEYGVSGACDTAMQEPVASSCLKELSFWDLAYKESAEAKSQQPSEHKTPSWQAPHLLNFTHKCQSPSGDLSACSYRSPTQKHTTKENTQPSENRYSRPSDQASRRDWKTTAVMVIQRFWREHRQRRRTGLLGPHAILSPEGKREVKSSKTRPKCLNKDSAATVIQAVWRGYTLRKRLTHALMLAQISEEDEAFEEVDLDEFIFDEEAMERDWSTLHSDVSPSSVPPYSEQLLLPKPLLPLSELHKNAPVQPWKSRQAWISSEDASGSKQSQSPDPSIRMQSPGSTLGKCSLSERSEKLLEEWGIRSNSTALLMLKRAQRMKARKQQHQRKLLAGKGDVSIQEALKVEPEQIQTQLQTRHRTYQWLQTQAVPSQSSSAPSASDHFLPEIDPEILSGRRVQLVASTGYRDALDSAVRQWIGGTGFSSLQDQRAHSQTHWARHARNEVPSSQRVTLAPSRKERISFRDNPTQLSGGWGGGKKRSKVNKLK